MKNTALASLGVLGVMDAAQIDFWGRLALYAVPVVVGVIQSLRKRKGQARTAKARKASLTRREPKVTQSLLP